jgi:hypothetical protein
MVRRLSFISGAPPAAMSRTCPVNGQLTCCAAQKTACTASRLRGWKLDCVKFTQLSDKRLGGRKGWPAERLIGNGRAAQS